MTFKKSNNKSTISNIMIAVVFLTNLTQLPIFVQSEVTSLISFSIWGILFFLFFIMNKKQFILNKELKLLSILVITLFTILAINMLITGNNQFSVTYIYPLLISLFIYLIGYSFSYYFQENDIDRLYITYIFGIVIVAIYIYINYFNSGFSWSERQYVYGSKNSISQMVLTAIVLLLVLKCQKTRFIKIIFKWCLVGFLTIFLLMLRSRGSIIAIPLIVIYMLTNNSINKKTRIIIGIASCIFLFMLFKNQSFYKFVFENIIFGNRETRNLDDISSGRITIIVNALRTWKDTSIFWGCGSYYFDCFYLSTFVQSGLLPGVLIDLIALSPLGYALTRISHKTVNSMNRNIFIILAVIYSLNGIFEGLAPLGPGVKCYFLWLLYGMLSGPAWNTKVSIVDR